MPKKKTQTIVEKKPDIKKWHGSRFFVVFTIVLLLVVIVLAGAMKYVGIVVMNNADTESVGVSAPSSSSGSATTDVTSVKVGDAVSVSSTTSGPQVVATGTFGITVMNVDSAMSDIEALAKKENGVIENSQVLHNADTCDTTIRPMMYAKGAPEIAFAPCNSYDATVTLRVPSTKFAETRDALRRIDENQQLDSEQTSTADVTDQASQIASRLKTAQTEESALQDILAKATSVDDILKVRTQLTTVRSEIENLLLQQANLKKDVTYSRIVVTLSEASAVTSSTPSVQARFALAWKSLLDNVSSIGTFGIYLVVYAVLFVPLLAVVGIVVWLIIRHARRVKKRKTQ
jgi:uncharacterized protein (UPF0333 family)